MIVKALDRSKLLKDMAVCSLRFVLRLRFFLYFDLSFFFNLKKKRGIHFSILFVMLFFFYFGFRFSLCCFFLIVHLIRIGLKFCLFSCWLCSYICYSLLFLSFFLINLMILSMCVSNYGVFSTAYIWLQQHTTFT